MSNIAIKVENLGKKYLIRYEKQDSYETLQVLMISGSMKIISSLDSFDKKDNT